MNILFIVIGVMVKKKLNVLKKGNIKKARKSRKEKPKIDTKLNGKQKKRIKDKYYIF